MQFCWCFLPHVTKTAPSKKSLWIMWVMKVLEFYADHITKNYRFGKKYIEKLT